MNYATRITSRRAHAKALVLGGIVLALAAAAAVGIAARLGVWSLPTSGPSAEQPPSPPARLPQAGEGSSETAADVTAEPEPAPIDPKLIQYRQTGSIAVAMKAVYALAVGLEDRIYVGGDKAIQGFDAHGTRQTQIALEDQPCCLAVGQADHVRPGRIYVGMRKHVEVLGPDGARAAVWEPLGEKAMVTSIAAAEQDVFVADAGNRIVWHFDTAGKLLGRIGARDDARNIPGFVITSPYFDLVVCPDGLLRVVNPRALRIEAYTFRGDLEAHWGQAAPTIDGFFGCCNPAHLAVLPDGRIVTAEKGAPRVKVYSSDGKFLCVVAGPHEIPTVAADLAADRNGRVLILDPVAKAVRIFEPKQAAKSQP